MKDTVAPFRFFVFTNNVTVASAAVAAGVSRIVVDLEFAGKEQRQRGLNSVISRHTLEDISAIRAVVPDGTLVVRVNPLSADSKQELEEIIARGADHTMLPMWESADDLKRFIDLLKGRSRFIPLLETQAAARDVQEAVEVQGVDEMHIGLTDLHLQLGMRFLFEVLSEGYLDQLAEWCRSSGITFGFGGVGRVGVDPLPAEWVLAEHERLGSSGVILSRSFLTTPETTFAQEIEKLRAVLDGARTRSEHARLVDQVRTIEQIRKIASERA